MGFFFKRSRAAYSAVRCQILSNFKVVRYIMVVLHTCKNEEDPMKNEDARVLTRLYVTFRRLRAANSEVSVGILPKFELIQAFIVFLVTCKNEEDPIKKEGARVLTSLLSNFSYPQGHLTPKSVVEFRRNSKSSKLL